MTINLVPLFRKKKELYLPEDEVTILVRLFVDNKILNLSSGIKVRYENWNPNWKNTRKKNPIKDKEPNHIEKNLLLKTKEKEIKDIVFEIERSGGIPTVDLIKTHLRTDKIQKKKKSLSDVHFIILLEKYYDWIKSEEYKILTQNTDSYIRSVVGSIKDLIRFSNVYEQRENIQLTTEDIDTTFVSGLIKFCDKRGLQPSTIKKRLKVLVSFSKWVGDKIGVIFSIPIPKKVFTDIEKDIIFLKRDEVLKIYKFDKLDYSNENHLDYKKKGVLHYMKNTTPKRKKDYTIVTSYEVYKDMLLFLCGTGMRFGDLITLRVDDKEFDSKDRMKGEIKYQSEKTKKITRVPLNRLTMNIFNKYSSGKGKEDYLFPRTNKGNSISGTKFNKHIKEICKEIGLNRGVKSPQYNLDRTIVKGTEISVELYEKVSSHIGRKTFIREQIESGTPPRVIMSMTGHKSQKVFDGYYNILKGDRMKNNDKIFSTNLKDDESENSFGITKHQEEKLKKEKSLFDIGLLPKEIYLERVREIMG
jgi:integrase